MKMIFLITLTLSLSVLAGVKIAVIDSGTDVKHEALLGKIWTNEKEDATSGRDEDGNDYPNDVNGWNFAENNNQLVDYSMGSLYKNEDLFKVFEIQKKKFQNRATEEDLKWVKEKMKEEAFYADYSYFGNFIHGTHVSAITTLFAHNPEVIGMKLLPTKPPVPPKPPKDPEVEKPAKHWGRPAKPNTKPELTGKRIDLIKNLLNQAALANAQSLIVIGNYVRWTEAEVANGSFGIGPQQSKTIVSMMFKVLFFREPMKEESELLIKHFLEQINLAQKDFVLASPSTLFVFAAGNDGSDNDVLPSAPASVGGDNVISVAASYGNIKLAHFSNYGKTKVDLAAPGVFIRSAIPLNKYMEVSGTSQASPRVAAAAAAVFEANPKLTPKEVKKILMDTVDHKTFLTDKVVSGGVLNEKRAIYAADLTRGKSLEEAALVARVKVKDLAVNDPDAHLGSAKNVGNMEDIIPIEMPSGFDLR